MVPQGCRVVGINVHGLQKITAQLQSKHYLYVLNVVLSDGSHYCVVKTHQQFVKFDEELNKAATENGWTIPKRLKKTGGAKENHRIASERQQNIAKYCGRLLDAEDAIKDSDIFRSFFHRSRCPLCGGGDDGGDSTAVGAGVDPSGPSVISGPIHLPYYRTNREFKAADNRQLSLQKDVDVKVYKKCDSGWWYVIYNEKAGWFPATYLTPLEQQLDEVGRLARPEKYVAVGDYEAKRQDEISFSNGDIVDVLEKRLDGWWLMQSGDGVGIGPSKYLRQTGENDDGDLCNICDETIEMDITERRSSASNQQVPTSSTTPVRAVSSTTSNQPLHLTSTADDASMDAGQADELATKATKDCRELQGCPGSTETGHDSVRL